MSSEHTEVERHVLLQVGWNVRVVGAEVRGEAPVIEQVLVPGAPQLRVAMLANWADHLIGLLAVRAMQPRVPTTLDLNVHLYRAAPGSGQVCGTGRIVKSGRNVLTAAVEFADETGEVFALGSGSFMAAGDPSLRMGEVASLGGPARPPSLTMPIAERLGCMRQAPGRVSLPRSGDSLNHANILHGGVLAIVVEEALLSLAEGAALSSLSLRYVRSVRVGPAVATARLRDGLGTVEVRDAGDENRLAVVAIARLFEVGKSRGT